HPIDAADRRTSTPVCISGGAIRMTAMPSNALAVLSRLFVLFVVVDFGELRIDDVFLLAVGAGRATWLAASLLLGGLLVHRLAKLHGRLCQSIGLGGDRLGVAAFESLFEVGQGVLDHAAIGFANFRAVFGERLLGRMHQSLGVVLGLDLRLALLVIFGVRL